MHLTVLLVVVAGVWMLCLAVLQIDRSQSAMNLPRWDNSPQWSASINDSFQLPDSAWLDRAIGRPTLLSFVFHVIHGIWMSQNASLYGIRFWRHRKKQWKNKCILGWMFMGSHTLLGFYTFAAIGMSLFSLVLLMPFDCFHMLLWCSMC